jgi:DNA mismatch repair protein MutS2
MRERDLKALEFDKVIAMVARLTLSEPGRRAVEALRPARETAEVRERLRATSELTDLRAHSGSIPIDEFDDQRPHLMGAAPEDAVLNGPSLVRIRDFVVSARTAEAFLRSRVETRPHVAAIVRNLIAPRELADVLLKSLGDDGGLVDEASAELKRIRTSMRNERLDLETRLARSLNAQGMEPIVSDHLVTVRNRRFVLPLKLNYSERIQGIVQDRSVSGETLFVEPMWAVGLNNRLMMLEREAEAEEYRLLMRLTAIVRGYLTELRMTFSAMVELDALNARAIFAERFGGIEPDVADDGGIELIAARHPLLVTTVPEVVPIDVRINAGQHGLVVSGPNTGGKTVALKTIGLFALMAQAGILIPAATGSRVRVFRGIFADIGDEQSIEASLSSFAGHIANLTGIIRHLEEPALAILDEPGGGTDPVEGAALAIGLMDYLGQRGCIVVIATHSAAVKLHAYSRAGFDAAAVDFDPERLVPLYRIKPHTIGQSYGLAVARRLGLPTEIVDAAEAALPAGSAELAEALRRLEEERTNLRIQAERFARREHELAEREREASDRGERERERASAERERVRREGARAIEELRREGSMVIEDIKAGAKNRRELGQTLRGAAEKLERIAPLERTEADSAPEQPLQVGDHVELGEIRGEILQIDDDRATVGRGGLRIEVSLNRLRRARGSASVARPPQVTVAASDDERSELNLIGMRTAEALRRLEEFLDQAYLTNRSEVRVVHGIGSGALKKAVHDYLSSSPYCAAYRQAEPHRGGAGATIVELGQ